MTPSDAPTFVELKHELESQPRLAGYYIIKLLDITDVQMRGETPEEIAEEVFQVLDDQKWPPKERRPEDQSWADYAVEREEAKTHVVDALVGGPAVGHLAFTIPSEQAVLYFNRFDQLFDEPKRYFVALGFGDREYVFSGGVAIISRTRAGILWVVEDD